MDYHITKIVGYVVDASSEKEGERIVRENELENPLAYFSKQVPYQFEDAVTGNIASNRVELLLD